MTEFMTEQLVKREKTFDVTLKKAALIAISVIAVFLTMFVHPIFVWLASALIVADVILFGRMNLEFEYVYFNGDLDIDKIMNKQSRKRMFSTNIREEMDLIAPTGSPELHQFQGLKKLDYSTKNPENKTYTMITMHKGEKVQVIFEPNEDILKGIRDLAPRKIIF